MFENDDGSKTRGGGSSSDEVDYHRDNGRTRARKELPFSTADGQTSSSSSSTTCYPSIEKNAKVCRPEREILNDLDVVTVAAKPTCANKLALISLRQYVNPRRIVVITTERKFCEKFVKATDGVLCFMEDDLIDGITKDVVNRAIGKFSKNKDDDDDDMFMGRSLSGWYLQQFIKLSIWQTKKLNPPISKQYLVWDSDMILLRRMRLFDDDDDKNSNRRRKAIRAIGGNVVVSYKRTYERLMSSMSTTTKTTKNSDSNNSNNNKVQYASDGTSYVAHQMIFDSNIAKELLETFANNSLKNMQESDESANNNNNGPRLPPWAEAIIREAFRDSENAHIGFSEYESYASFVSTRHPELVKSLTRKNWARNPFFAGSIGVVVSKYVRDDGLCCPTNQILTPARWRGLAYVGFEIGHAEDTCDIKNSKYKDGYGWE